MAKVAMITGGASGIGRAGCLLFAERGVVVVAVDVNKEGLGETVAQVRALGGTAYELVADLSQTSCMEAMVADAAAMHGGLDILWNNAGINGPQGVEAIAGGAYAETLRVNLTAGVLASTAAVPYLRKRQGGSILFTSSISGLVGSARYAVYSMTKFGMIGFAKSMAVQLAREGIRVNVICPGAVATPMADRLAAETKPINGKDYRQAALEAVPMGRSADPREIAEAAYWLSSDDASYVTGIAMPVDGGFTCR